MPTLPKDFLERIEERDSFHTLVYWDYEQSLRGMGLGFHLNRSMMSDAYFQWHQDMERIRKFEEDVGEPDHIKRSAHLAYWLRRFSPVNDFTEVNGFSKFDWNTDFGEFFMKYGREFLAFDLAYRAAAMHERSIRGRDLPDTAFSLSSSFEDMDRNDFVKTVCHVMKTKMLSPQALVVALKAVFLRP